MVTKKNKPTSGHDHTLQHLRVGWRESGTCLTHFIVSGGGGYVGNPHKILREEWHNANNVENKSHYAQLLFAETMWGFVKVVADTDILTMEFINDKGQLVYTTKIPRCLHR